MGGPQRLAWNFCEFPWRSCDVHEAVSPESSISDDKQHVCLDAFVTNAITLFFC